ncbi:MAG: SOS response-associated peptidase [Blastocatellia bacterium]|nr:SOS response-associated peptidase [Blastocatellia bacterium]
MCGRFTNRKPEKIKIDGVHLSDLEGAKPRYNIAPSQHVAVVYDESPNTLSEAKWGLIPSWSKDPGIGYKMINARSETLLEKPSFRGLVKKRRCLILADSLYEWRKNEDDSKTPMRIQLKSKEAFAFAGLWDVWKTPEGEWLKTCTIITGEPNELVAPIHNRLAIILQKEVEREWINPANEVGHVMSLLKPYPAKEMMAYEVSRRVNNVKNDEAELVKPV